MDLVLGLDVGGTSSRALLTTLEGARAGYGRAGAGSPVAVGAEAAAANVAEAVRAALSDVDTNRVKAAVIGAAGAAGSTVFQDLFPRLGLNCPVRVVGDVVVAFASGSTSSRGTVLIAGTGAVAAEVEGFTEIRVGDGLGWLLGDLGSGFWLGREAASATARTLGKRDIHLTAGRLAELVSAEIGETDPDAFVVKVHAGPPRALARLAPLVTRAAEEGDPVALRIVESASAHLIESVSRVREPAERTPIVLAGSVLAHCGPVRERVRRGLAQGWPGAPLSAALPGETGAARLAATLVERA